MGLVTMNLDGLHVEMDAAAFADALLDNMDFRRELVEAMRRRGGRLLCPEQDGEAIEEALRDLQGQVLDLFGKFKLHNGWTVRRVWTTREAMEEAPEFWLRDLHIEAKRGQGAAAETKAI